MPRVIARTRTVAVLCLVFILSTLAGCAAGAPPAEGPAPETRTEEPETLLEPAPAAVRAAERAQLTGLELGKMWTFENPPLEYWARRYEFRPSADWLEHVRLSSVRYGNICSASFVSPNGLTMTNHHCARDCVEAVSTEATDYVEEGFYAEGREEEVVCPDLFLDQLVEIKDVTARVQAAVSAEASPTEVAAARERAREAIVEECEAETADRCEVVSLYRGGQYQLYRYRRYQPVKLVFAPELQAGFFGGDPDNFTYPRHTLDVAFVRAYRPDGTEPARTPNHFAWDPGGAHAGELVFITGNPGGTNRLATVSQLQYERHYRHPFIIQLLENQREFLLEIAEQGPEAERSVRDQLFSVENSLKAFRGQLGGLRDTMLMGRKILWEDTFQRRVMESPELADEYGDVWERMEEIQEDKLQVSPPLNLTSFDFIGSPHMQLAGMLVRYVRETARPEAERLEGYRGEALEPVAARLREPTQLNPEISADLLAIRLELARSWLPEDDPFLEAAFRPGETPEQAAERLVRTTRVGDVEYRRALMVAGPEALDTVQDPLVRLAARMDRRNRELQARWEELTAAESVQEERLARALFAVYGTDVPPDATFTLRISDGVVRAYPYNGTMAPPKTTYYGLYERAANFNNREPWTLPDAFAEHRDAINMAVPLNFVATTDITGGNSGSPMIDREARVVGVAFDGNIEQLPNEFLFSEVAARTVAVHSAGIIEALDIVYDADALVAELLGEDRR